MVTVIVVLYLGAMIALGFLYKKRASQGEESYLVANRSMGPAIGGGTLASTYASTSSFLGTLGAMYALGIAFGMWQNLGAITGFALAAIFIAPKFRNFEPVSFSQFFEQRYDRRVRFVAAVVTVVAMFVYVLIQLQGGSYAMQYVLGVDHRVAVLVIGCVLLTYVLLGGSHSSIMASFIQFCMMMVAMLTVTGFVLATEQWSGTAAQAAETSGTVFDLGGSSGTVYGISVALMMCLGVMSSPHVYLMFMFAKSNKSAQKMTALATTYLAVFYFVLLFVGTYIIGNFPNLDNPDMGYFEVVDMLPLLIMGVFVAAVLAAAMSTTDAQLLNATSAITNDLYSIATGKSLPMGKRVMVNRVVMLCLGVGAIIIALDPPELILWLLALAQTLMIGAFLVPLVLGLWWKKATATAAFAGMIVGFSVAVLTQFMPLPNEFLGGPIAALFSLVVMVVVTQGQHRSPAGTSYTDEVAGHP